VVAFYYVCGCSHYCVYSPMVGLTVLRQFNGGASHLALPVIKFHLVLAAGICPTRRSHCNPGHDLVNDIRHAYAMKKHQPLSKIILAGHFVNVPDRVQLVLQQHTLMIVDVIEFLWQ